jgi:hypothetical protein
VAFEKDRRVSPTTRLAFAVRCGSCPTPKKTQRPDFFGDRSSSSSMRR